MKPGDRVATLAMNHDRHLVAWFGVVGMGGVLHTLNPRLFDDQLDYIINHAEDRVLLYDRAVRAAGRADEAATGRRSSITSASTTSSMSWLGAEDGDYRWHEGDERDPCGLCYTSGTTGNPKGVLYEHRSTVLHAMSIIAPDIFDVSARSVMLPVVPMFHAGSWCLPYAAAIAGLQAGHLRRQQARAHLPPVQRGGGHPLGRRADRLAEHDRPRRGHRRVAWASCGTIIVGGSSAPPATIRWFRERDIRVSHCGA